MSRRDNAQLRCSRCRMHGSLCLCTLIPRITTRTRLVLVIHRFEERKPTNTGRLATECLTESEVFVRGHESRPSDTFVAAPGTQPLLLFPHEEARDLREFASSTEPLTLVVPDGTWRQASKVRQRVSGLGAIPCVKLPPGPPTRYQLRFESHDDGLATVEAIARAFGILEGVDVQEAIETVFSVMVDRTLWARGGIEASRVRGGIPEGATRHDPRRRGTNVAHVPIHDPKAR